MEIIYYLVGVALILVIGGGLAGLVKPSWLAKILGKYATRKSIAIIAAAAFVVFGGLLSATEPDSVKQARLAKEHAAQIAKQQADKPTKQEKPKSPKIEKRTITEKQSVKFGEQRVDDPALAKGTEKVSQDGKDGEKTITYEVTVQENKEISRTKISEEVTMQPTSKVIKVGTYVAPAVSVKLKQAASNPTNQPVQSSNLPLKAICNDGTISYQDTPSKPDYRGMCSKHKGIKTKLGRVP